MDDELLLQESNNICTICIEPVQIDSIYFKCTNCKQTIHFECLLEWFKKREEVICPVCRNTINDLNQNLVNIEPDYFQKNNIIIFRDILINIGKIRRDLDLGPVYNTDDTDTDTDNTDNIDNNNFLTLQDTQPINKLASHITFHLNIYLNT